MRLILDGQPLARFELVEAVTVRGYTVPEGFISDGESVPAWAQGLFPRASKAMIAAFAHDHRMQSARDEDERILAHRHFRRDLEAFGVTNWRRQLMWRATLLADDRIRLSRRLTGAIR